MKGKLVASLFALPFLGIGAWMLISISLISYDALRMQTWVPVQARLTAAGFATHTGEDADTYEAFAEYEYDYHGHRYRGDRAMIARGGDNLGDFQRRLGSRLELALRNELPVTIFVNPAAPEESTVDRTLRWGLLGFKSIFVILFGGFGLGLIVFTWRAPAEKDRSLPIYREQPWLLNDAWQTPEIRSNSKASMYAAWLFAAVWNLISAPLPFLLYEEIVDRGNTLALIGLVFPLVGLWLLIRALRHTREWTRIGPAPVMLDPFPGSIGGHVGGTIDLRVPFDSARQYRVSLTSIHSYESGSGDDRGRSEKARWQDAMIAHSAPGPLGTRLTFRFDVPEDLPESDTEQDDSYNLWRLGLEAELAEMELDRSYEIPVFATGAESRLLSDRVVEESRATQEALDEAAIRRVFELRFGPTGRSLHFPMGRHLGPSLGGLVAGLLFIAAGWWLVVKEDMTVFGSVFALSGGVITVLVLYFVLNSLEVRQQGSDIVTIRRLLGLPLQRHVLHRHEFRRFESASSFQARSDGKHVMFYKVLAVDRSGRKIVIGDGFRGENEARAAIRLIGRELGLSAPAPDRDASHEGRFSEGALL